MNNNESTANNKHNFTKLNKSFARRIGKTLNQSKKHIIESELPRRSLKLSSIITQLPHQAFPSTLSEQQSEQDTPSIIMEIGFGMGEHFFHQITKYQNKFFVGAEVYINGVAELLHQVSSHESSQNISLNNFLIWPDDVDILLTHIPDQSIEQLYILFPDPWPKRKQHKKRLVSADRLPIIKAKLQKHGMLIFASDIDHYFDSVLSLIENDRSLQLLSTDFHKPHDNYVTTKYHKKAIREGRIPRFMQVIKSSAL